MVLEWLVGWRWWLREWDWWDGSRMGTSRFVGDEDWEKEKECDHENVSSDKDSSDHDLLIEKES